MNTIAISTGIDIVEVARMKRAASQWRGGFFEKVFTRRERAYAARRAAPHQHLAARFAAKEAVLKAFGGGHGQGIPWTDIEVDNAPSGEPTIRLHGRMAALQARLGVTHIAVSMSHTRTYAVASVVVVRTRGIV